MKTSLQHSLRGLWHSVAFRLALNYALLAAFTAFVLVAVFYLQTVGTLKVVTERQIAFDMQRLESQFAFGGRQAVADAITRAITDGKDSDSEIYLLLDTAGTPLAGNMRQLPQGLNHHHRITEFLVQRPSGEAPGQLLMHILPDGSRLVVGRDMQDQERLESLVGQASQAAGLAALLLVVIGTYIFRLELQRRIGAIRRTTARVSAGDITQRISQPEQDDEFSRLNGDINQMLDRMEDLMQGVRHVSNTIAHNLRTPLTRILARLRTAQGPQRTSQELREVISATQQEIEDLNIVFEKLLQIAEAESGARRQGFSDVLLDTVVADVVDLYGAVAEEQDATLVFDAASPANPLHDIRVTGDSDLLAGAVANLVDNALKYAGAGAAVRLRTFIEGDHAVLLVQDDGPGIAPEDRARVGTRFFRRSPHSSDVPGYGLGLSSVFAIIHLHGGTHTLEPATPGTARPGLRVRITLPLALGPVPDSARASLVRPSSFPS
ncbi:MAG: HAMP domain-containing protein [Comamonadaceae bacterium]|nr:MAG: HAMP domain-containing protein [Comamonadaceae bacterium]